jgi:hypothetical protein
MGQKAVESRAAEVESVSSNSKTVSQVLPKSLHNANKGLHNGDNVQRKFQETLMQANSQTINQEAVRECADKMRARRPRPYLDNNK